MKTVRLALLCGLALLCSLAAPAQTNPRGDDAGTGNFDAPPIHDQPVVVWEVHPGFRDYGPMAVSGNVLVTGNTTSDGGPIALDTATGRKLWAIPGQMKGEPAVDLRAAYVISRLSGGSDRLNALDLKTGRKLWSVEAPDLGTNEAGPLVDGGRVYLISDNGQVAAYDAATGHPLWDLRYSPEKGYCPTAFSIANGVLYFGGGESSYSRSAGIYLWAVDAASGKTLWRYAADPGNHNRRGECVTSPAVSGGVVATASGRTVFALDATRGTLLWKKDAPGQLSDPIIPAGGVYASAGKALIGWSLRGGAPTLSLPGDFGQSAVVPRIAAAGGVLYFLANLPSDKGGWFLPLHAYDLKERRVLWEHRVNRPDRYNDKWPTDTFLPTADGLYYENCKIIVKIH